MTAAPNPTHAPAARPGHDLAQAFLDAACQSRSVGYAASRWQDEREYEDIDEYRRFLQEVAPAGVTITKMTGRPFGCEFTVMTAPGSRFKLSIYSTGRVTVKRI